MRQRATCFLMLLLATLSVAANATNECVVYPDIDDEFNAVAAVFVGRVLAVNYVPGRECCHILSGSATFEVDRSWKGSLRRRMEIGAVGPIFEVGKEYVVFAFGPPPLVADGCNSTKATSAAKQTLEWLSRKPSRRVR